MIIGLDVGGTHADAVLLNENRLERNIKVPTDPSNLFNTVLSCFDFLLEDIAPDQIKRVVISTTLTTNSLLQRNLDPVGMIVSAGPGIDPLHFKTGEHYYAVSGSIDHRGREIQPIVPGEIESIAQKMSQDGIQHIGVVSKFSPRNPSHELTIQSLLKEKFSTIFLGHKVSGNLNFPRRIATVYLNAAVYSLHQNFFNAVTDTLKQKGLTVPLQILKADGGTMNLPTSMEFPGQTILSGPAASIMGAIPHASENQDMLVLDIGGTTTDLAVLVNKAPLLEPIGISRGRYKSLIRALKTTSQGIGGDSEVKVIDGALDIGPKRKGPAMAFGGPMPTPTDAMIYLNIMDLGGDVKKAEKGMKEIASQLECSPWEAAEEIVNQTCALIVDLTRSMVEQLNSQPVYTVHEFLEGYRIVPQKILLLGGPAPYLAARIGEISGIETQAVPMSAVANAIGAALARTTCEISLFADTTQNIISAPEEGYQEEITSNFCKADALKTAKELLDKKAVLFGADPDKIESEVIEFHEFNVVRRFSLQGKIFRVKMQIKPGLIAEPVFTQRPYQAT